MRKLLFVAAAAMLTFTVAAGGKTFARSDSDSHRNSDSDSGSDSDRRARNDSDSDTDSDSDRNRNGQRFLVTITNLTRGQSFTPILVASHNERVKLFELGGRASDELSALAEAGATDPLGAKLLGMSDVKDVATSSGLLGPGESTTVSVATHNGFRYLSVASMLIPTNDAFLALNGVSAPKLGSAGVLLSPAYDAGSETNDELCSNIPGPVCAGQGLSPADDGEGFVFVHAGIHDIGDLHSSERDWRNPVARIKVRHVR